jgi:DNA replicative helicase MCM subunit Mcm2 (Cdc46/Mcm family)
MSQFPVPCPPDLTLAQKNDLQRLWEVQTRQVVDVRPTSEASSTQKSSMDDPRTYRFVVRLHLFFLSFLQKGVQESLRQEKENIDSNTQDNDDDTSLIKDVRQSCLEPLARLFLPSPRESSNQVRLREGRRVFSIHYDEFMGELNHFEFKGQASPEVLRRDSFGAYLHHFPIHALPAINAAMGLAVATLWRSQHTQAHNSSSKLDRFLDNCQVTVRFLHVTPQLPMADIKTGLVRKFISVKGHVIKARPKRLRVATADFACQKCAALVTHAFDQGRFSLPTKCSNSTCRAKSFTLIRSTARYTNVQELRFQEAQEESTSHAGRTPRQMEVELTHDLIDSCRPGDIVLLACYVDAVNSAVSLSIHQLASL